jgi:hypothetical protein
MIQEVTETAGGCLRVVSSQGGFLERDGGRHCELGPVHDRIDQNGPVMGQGGRHSLGHIDRLQRVADNDADYVAPLDMLVELCDRNVQR